MFGGWLKGIGANILNTLGLGLALYGAFGSDEKDVTKVILGVVLLVVGSYLKYVSKQTVKTK